MLESINTVKMQIIEMLTQIYDLTQLNQIATSLSNLESSPNLKDELFQNNGVKIENAPSFDEIYQAQGSKQITYEEILVGSEDVEWEYSLDEMLAALD